MADSRRHLKHAGGTSGIGRSGWRWAIGVFLALAWVGGACAQTGANAPAMRFTVFAAKPLSDVAYVPRAGVPPQKLAFYPTARSPRYEYRGPMPLRFLDATSGAVIAEATIPAGMRDALLLFSPIEAAPAAGKSGSLRYQVAVLDDSVGRQAAGTVAIINLSGLALSGTVNRENVALRAGLNPAIAVGRAAAIKLRTTYNKREYQAYGATVSLAPKQRALVILLPPFNKGSLEVQSRVLLDEPGMPPPR